MVRLQAGVVDQRVGAAQVISTVAIEGRLLSFGRRKGEPLARLAMECLNHQAEQRPTFSDICSRLELLRAAHLAHHPPAAPGA